MSDDDNITNYGPTIQILIEWLVTSPTRNPNISRACYDLAEQIVELLNQYTEMPAISSSLGFDPLLDGGLAFSTTVSAMPSATMTSTILLTRLLEEILRKNDEKEPGGGLVH